MGDTLSLQGMVRSPMRITTFPIAILMLCGMTGCGTTLSRSATEQLLASSAVDLAVAQIDFTAMSGKTVFFDSTAIRSVKGIGFVNGDYIVSALRQQLVAARCLLSEDRGSAEYIVEARIGALGTDGHDITYGIPASSGLNVAASIVPSLPQIPMVPEISIAKKTDQSAASKISVFAYHRESREPIWQSGLAEGYASAKDLWIAGAGPFQSGTIYDSPQFAGTKITFPFFGSKTVIQDRGPVGYFAEHRFPRSQEPEEEPEAEEKPESEEGQTADGEADTPEPDGNSPDTDSRTDGAAASVNPLREFHEEASLLISAPAPDIFVELPRTENRQPRPAPTEPIPKPASRTRNWLFPWQRRD